MKSKFKEYFLLNMSIVQGELFYAAFAGVLFGIVKRNVSLEVFENIENIVLIPALICIPVFWKLCSQILYDREAYFYQSFPVSNKEIVFTKTLVPTFGMSMCIFFYVIININYAGLLPIGILIAFTVSNIVFSSITICNMFKSSRAKQPSAIVALIMTYLIVAIQIWMAKSLIFNTIIPDRYKMILLAVFLITESAAFFFGNVRNMRLYYRI